LNKQLKLLYFGIKKI